MKVGIDTKEEHIYVSIQSGSGVVNTMNMNAHGARFIAEQLMNSADTLDSFTSENTNDTSAEE